VSWEVHWTNRALKDLRRLDRSLRESILDAVDRFSETGEGDIRRLHGKQKELYRLRARPW
jgi:mRNA-degrading endonuclease RelE of RelBE toxin-antitoxin system